MTHAGLKPYACGECGKCFIERSKLKRHMVRHSGSSRKKYTCNKCHKKYVCVKSFEYHVKYCTEICTAHEEHENESKNEPET